MGRFKPDEHVIYDRQDYIYVSQNPDGSHNVKRMGTNTVITVPPDELHSFLREGRTSMKGSKLNG